MKHFISKYEFSVGHIILRQVGMATHNLKLKLRTTNEDFIFFNQLYQPLEPLLLTIKSLI